jgi:hypothetical protein
MTEYEQYLRISSTDGKNTVESIINDLKKQAHKGQVEFGVDITVERVDPPAEREPQEE